MVLTARQKHGPLMKLSISGAVEKEARPKKRSNWVERIPGTAPLGPPLGNMMIEIYRPDGEAT
jgi:hypothetical protein